jgi:hypothetical protein
LAQSPRRVDFSTTSDYVIFTVPRLDRLVRSATQHLAAQTKIESRERKHKDEEGVEDDEPFCMYLCGEASISLRRTGLLR